MRGIFRPPGDKSISHRIALMSLLSEGTCTVENLSTGEDVLSSMDAVRRLGGDFEPVGNAHRVVGMNGSVRREAAIDCGNSGTTMRLLMGILAAMPGTFVLDGDASLRRRPMKRVAEPLGRMGATIATNDGSCPIEIHGSRLQGIEYALPVASAQLKSALLLAGIQAHGVTTVIEPSPSRDHTEKLLASFGARISRDSNAWTVEQSRLSLPESLYVPGDSSSAAFFLCAAAVLPGSEITAEHVLLNPTRTGFLDVLRAMGVACEVSEEGVSPESWGSVSVTYSDALSGCVVREEQIPSLVDEVPILALVATQAHGTTIFEGVEELRIKESDRLSATASQLGAMGAKMVVEADRLIVEGPTPLSAPTELESFGDHRIAMTLRLAGLLTDGVPAIAGEESVNISYPGFHDTLRRLTA